jgi:hypothetical protein
MVISTKSPGFVVGKRRAAQHAVGLRQKLPQAAAPAAGHARCPDVSAMSNSSTAFLNSTKVSR